jgi:hypothetical protein
LKESAVPSVEVDEWKVGLPESNSRRILLLSDVSSESLIGDVIKEVEAEVDGDSVVPDMEPSQRWGIYRRFHAVVRLSEDTFDLLMNGRMLARCAARAERPCRRATEQHDELAAPCMARREHSGE